MANRQQCFRNYTTATYYIIKSDGTATESSGNLLKAYNINTRAISDQTLNSSIVIACPFNLPTILHNSWSQWLSKKNGHIQSFKESAKETAWLSCKSQV